jgi:alanyl-tRNA synthetase
LVKDGRSVPKISAGDKAEIITAATPFYVEAGGEVSDTGVIDIPGSGAQFRVDEAAKPTPGLVIHRGEVVDGDIEVGQEARLLVDDERRADIRRNHTATHILHRELRAHLGNHVTQQGSLVAPDRLRFDFSHDQAVDKATLAAIEADINKAILANYPVKVHYMGQKEAIDKGAMALFGEKYGDIVRTITIGDDEPFSMELCGGLHVGETNDIGQFRFVHEGAVAAGVRRVEAVTGHGAQALIAERLAALERVEQLLNAPLAEVETRLANILAENKALHKEVARLQRQVARSQFDGLLAQVKEVAGVTLLTAQVEAADVEMMREMADWFRDRAKSGVAVLAAVSNNKPVFIATVTDDLIKRGVKAGDIVREVAKVVGGGGGGRPNMAQAGGRDVAKIPEALAIVPRLIRAKIED